MYALRLWCLIALTLAVRCQLQEIQSGNGNDFGIPTDDEDDVNFDGEFASGSGGGPPQNATADTSTSVVVIQSTSTPRTTTIQMTSPTTTTTTTPRRTKPQVRTTSKQITTTTTLAVRGNEEDYDDEDLDNDDDKMEPEDEIKIWQTTPSIILDDDEPELTSSESTTAKPDFLEFIWRQPGIVAGLIGGAILGVLFAILLTLFIIYRMRRRADRTYRKGGARGSQDETGAFWFDDEEAGAIAYSRASAERYPSHVHGNTNANAYSQAGTLKGSQMLVMPASMNAQAQSLMYTPVASNSQNAYDEYLANLYNQQLYNGYMQQKA